MSGERSDALGKKPSYCLHGLFSCLCHSPSISPLLLREHPYITGVGLALSLHGHPALFCYIVAPFGWIPPPPSKPYSRSVICTYPETGEERVVHQNTHTHTHAYINAHACTRVHTHACTCTCTYTCTRTHTNQS